MWMAVMKSLVTVAVFGAALTSPMFRVTAQRESDRVRFQTEENKAIFDVVSPTGIGQAVIERTSDRWPDSVLIRLQLKGLEKFGISSEAAALEGSVSSHGDKPVIRIWKDGDEKNPLDSTSPWWMEIGLPGQELQPAGKPNAERSFELPLPKGLLKANPKSITVNWIDFYRN